MEYKATHFSGSSVKKPTLSFKEVDPWATSKSAPSKVGRYKGNDVDVVFPTEVKGVTITGVAGTTSKVPENYRAIVSVSLPEGYTTIGDYAFYGCDNLERINLPSTIQSIGKDAFNGCVKLKEILMPDAVTEIGDGAFFKIPSIEVAPGNSSFYTDQTGTLIDKSKKKVLWVPPNFKGRYIFSDDVCDIGEFAFAECDKLTAVVLPVSMKKIKEGTFWGCSRLNNLLLPDGITEIQQDAFAFCAIKNIILPETVQKIGDYAFAWCKLESITIPASVRVIGESAFGGNENLQNVTFQHQRFQVGKFKFLKIAGNAFSAAPCEEQLKRDFKQVFE
jgi:hypothetical protein